MDKTHTDFLQECEAELALLKERVAALEEKLAAWKQEQEQIPEPAPREEEAPVDFTAEAIGTVEDTPEPEPVYEPVCEPEPVPEPEPEPAPAEDDTARLPWRTDKPGVQVKNIRSGISLYDRALFIGTLFKEDYKLYDTTIRELNDLTTLDQAVDYIRTHFPEWNLHSDVVYNFMMAVRKKLG